MKEPSFRRHLRDRDVVRMSLHAIADNLGDRQLTDLWRVMGVADVLRGRRGWGEMRREGLSRGAPETGDGSHQPPVPDPAPPLSPV